MSKNNHKKLIKDYLAIINPNAIFNYRIVKYYTSGLRDFINPNIHFEGYNPFIDGPSQDYHLIILNWVNYYLREEKIAIYMPHSHHAKYLEKEFYFLGKVGRMEKDSIKKLAFYHWNTTSHKREKTFNKPLYPYSTKIFVHPQTFEEYFLCCYRCNCMCDCNCTTNI